MHLDPGEDDENIDAVWLFLQEFIGFTNQLLYELPKWLVSDNHAGEEARCAGPWLANFSLGQLVQFWSGMYGQVLLHFIGEGLW